MTHPLYQELLLLATDANARAAVNLAANGSTPKEQRKEWCKRTRAAFFPRKPEGMTYLRHSFWQQVEAKFIWEIAWGVLPTTDERKTRLAEWLKERREEAIRRAKGDVISLDGIWPPAASFQRAYTLPQPKDGRDGATAWTPRKEEKPVPNIFKKRT